NERDSGCKERPALADWQLRGEGFVESPVNFGKIHAGFLKQRAAFHHSRSSAAAFITRPEVFAKSRATVHFFQRRAYFVLQRGEEVSRAFFEHFLVAHFISPSPFFSKHFCNIFFVAAPR